MLIGQTFSDDQATSSTVQEAAMTNYNSSEDRASDILCCHYGSLSLSLHYPVSIAHYLFGEGVITKTRLAIIKYSLSTRKALLMLLKSIRYAVHINYRHLMIFASVLLKFSSNVPCAKAILKDCGKHIICALTLNSSDIFIEKVFPDDDIPEIESSPDNIEGNSRIILMVLCWI